MGVKLHTSQAKADLDLDIGKLMLRMVVLCQTEGKKRLNIHNQQGRAPSLPGEWLRKGTGHGQAGLQYEPTTPKDIATAGYVRLGFLTNVFYMSMWGAPTRKNRRKSLADLMDELKPKLAAMGLRS